MHACGHDGHTTMLLAAGRQLARTRDFDGTAYLIFQPAEEGRGGAQAMLADGLFERFPMEAVFGMHNWPGYPQGSMACSAGPVMASANVFKLVIHGVGGHAAAPHRGVDPMLVACQVVQAWQTIISRNKRPIDAAVLSVTMMHGGEAGNVIPDRCTVEGTVRTYSDKRHRPDRPPHARHRHAHLRRLRSARRLRLPAPGAGGGQPPARGRGGARVIERVVGPGLALPQEPAMPSEDFAFMLQAKAGAYCFIGNGDGLHRESGHGEGPCMLHNPSYDFNDSLLPLGATYWVELVREWLSTVQKSHERP
jgi:amidohydrolase